VGGWVGGRVCVCARLCIRGCLHEPEVASVEGHKVVLVCEFAVGSPLRSRHVTHVNESRGSHVTRVNESCPTCRRKGGLARPAAANESCLTSECVVNESCHTCERERVRSRIVAAHLKFKNARTRTRARERENEREREKERERDIPHE